MSSNTMTQRLQTFGLDKKESAVLLACLKGNKTPSDIAKNIKMRRSTVYFYIDRLKERGLITTSLKGRRRYVRALPLEKTLAKTIQNEEEKLGKQKKAIQGLSRELKKIARTANIRHPVTTYDNHTGIYTLIDNAIAAGQDIYWIGSFDVVVKTVGIEGFFKRMTWRRMDQSTTMYAITDSTYARMPRKLAEPRDSFRKIKFLEDVRDLPSLLGVYGDTIVIGSLSSNNIQIVEIHDALSAKLCTVMHKALWKCL